MKALVYEGIQHVAVDEVDDPQIRKDDDIIVKVTSTSICGSDLHLVHGMLPHMQKGTVMGHETMGIVEEAGKAVTRIKKGDRVIIPFPIACGRCWYCEHDLWSQCDNSNTRGEIGAVYGYSGDLGGYNGGQAEYLRVPYANVGPAKVPEELKDEQVLFLTDILPTSYWGVESAGVNPGDTVVILGCGPVGLLAVKWAIFKGAKRVIAVDRVGYRLDKAKKFGAETVNFEEQKDTGEYIYEITKGGADEVIDCVGMDGKMNAIEVVESALKIQGGSKSAIEIGVSAVRKGGTLMLVGVYGARYNGFPLGDLFSRNIMLRMGQCPAHSYVSTILDLIKANQFDATDIITHVLPLGKGDHAYEIFDKKEDVCIKVVLKP